MDDVSPYDLSLTGRGLNIISCACEGHGRRKQIPKCRFYRCFCLGWCSKFVGSESDQKQSVKLLQNMVYNTTQQSPPPPQQHTVCIYCTFILGRGRGGGGEREGRGATVHNTGVENTNMKWRRHLRFCVFIVPSFMDRGVRPAPPHPGNIQASIWFVSNYLVRTPTLLSTSYYVTVVKGSVQG